MNPKLTRARELANLLGHVQVQSLVNGSLIVIPSYPGIKPYNEEDGGGPGLFTRLSAAKQLERHLNALRKESRRGR